MAHTSVDELRLRWKYYMLLSEPRFTTHAGASASDTATTTESNVPLGKPTFHGIVDVECGYTKRHLDNSFRRRPWWSISTAQSDAAAAAVPLKIVEYEALEWDEVCKEPHVVTNNFMVRKGLCRKANFASIMARHVQKCGAACPLARGIPKTAVIDTVPVFHDRPSWLDFRGAMSEALLEAEELMSSDDGGNGSNTQQQQRLWILKPSLANKAAEIFIVTSLEEVEAAVKLWRDIGQWVLQSYVDRPLLLGGGRKFHMRVYALANGALDVYVFSEALVLMAVEPYAPSAKDTSARHAHITNTCVGTEHGGFLEEKFVRKFSELPELLLDEGAVADVQEAQQRVAALKTGIHASVAHVFAGLEGGIKGYMPIPNAFELYGLDFLVDADWQLYLLEANPTPDIKQTGARLDHVIGDLIEGMLRIGVDSRFPPPPCPAAHAQPLDLVWERVYSKPWPSAGQMRLQ